MAFSTHTEDNDAAQVIDVITQYHDYFSATLPFTDFSKYTLPHGMVVLQFKPSMDGLNVETFADMYSRVGTFLGSLYASGKVKHFAHHHETEPAAEIWVSGNIAAAVAPWSASTDGEKMAHSVAVIILHKHTGKVDSDENPWRISGICGGPHVNPAQPAPPVERDGLEDAVAPFQTLLARTKAREWEAIPYLLISGGAAVLSRDAEPPATLPWSEYVQLLQTEASNRPERRFEEFQPRRWGNTAFIWAPFSYAADGGEHAGQGVIACGLVQHENQWRIAVLVESIF
jgi:hypothetical protein